MYTSGGEPTSSKPTTKQDDDDESGGHEKVQAEKQLCINGRSSKKAMANHLDHHGVGVAEVGEDLGAMLYKQHRK
ncbi:hypothetical protein KY284_035276 [Solanum tuberosum]|nr:hypothetical protein KY284_035276 [Solanum tuberosum]